MSRLVVAINRVEFTIAAQTLYVIKVQQDADEWEVKRTYSDFRKLRDDVARVMKSSAHADTSSYTFTAAAHELPFPAKRLFGSRSERVVRERAVELHHFVIRLLLLTHTYRKAQKQQQEEVDDHDREPQASATVFFLLRDFLKPDGASLGSSGYGGSGSSGPGAGGTALSGDAAGDDDDVITRRMIRESKMLAMHPPPKTKSAPNVLAYYSDESDESHGFASKSTANLLRQESSIPILEEMPATTGGGAASGSSSGLRNHPTSQKTLHIASLRSRSQRTDSTASSHTTADDRLRTASTASNSTTERQRHVSNASSTSSHQYAQHGPTRTHSTAGADSARPRPISNHKQSPHQHSHSHHHHSQSQSQHRGASASSSTSSTAPIAVPSSSSSMSSSPSSMYIHGSAPTATSSSATAAAASRAHPHPPTSSSHSSSHDALESQRTPPPSSSRTDALSNLTTQKKKRATKTTTRSKPRSASAREARDTERKSKLSPQLAAQSVTLRAQKELEQFVSEYSALMILRYVDRFVNKAATKASGCYTVHAETHRLVIDSERFVEELDDTFKDLPADFAHNFRNPLAGNDWFFPPALDAYVQMKWKSFRGTSASDSSGGGAKSHASAYATSRSQSHRRRDADTSDSDDDDDTEYEYEEETMLGGGYMKPKKDFSTDEADVLDKMIANGTAGRDQMLRLRRQVNERGWNRRANPGDERTNSTRSHTKMTTTGAEQFEFWTDTEDDEELATSSSVERSQRQHTVVGRRERPSRREGGLV